MGIMDEIEDLQPTFEGSDDEVCELCFEDDYDHLESCPMSDSNKFFDEEMEYFGGCE